MCTIQNCACIICDILRSSSVMASCEPHRTKACSNDLCWRMVWQREVSKYSYKDTHTHTHTCSFLLIQIHQRVSHNTLTGWSLGTSVGWHSHSMSPTVCWDYLYANSHPSNIKHGLSRLTTHRTTLRLRKITSHRFRESLCRCSSRFAV